MKAVLLAAMSVLVIACAPSPAASPQSASDVSQTLSVEVSPSRVSGSTGVPIEAAFTLVGVDSAAELPSGVVRILVQTDTGPRTVGMVSLRSPGDESLDRSVRLDLASALSPEQLVAAGEAGRVDLSFVVEAPADAPPISLVAVEAYAAQ